jgi:hypothetical protein
MNKKGAIWITTTAVFIALLICVQAFTAPWGQLVTGSMVNLVLIVSVMTCGLSSGLTVALLSPVIAKFFGIGPLWPIIPFVMLGNSALVLIWHLINKLKFANKHVVRVVSVIVAAVKKFLVLFISIVKIAVLIFLSLPAQQAAAISGMFSVLQLFTASLDGAVALAVLPAVEKVRSIRTDS